MFELRDLLLRVGLAPEQVLVMRHCPTERDLRQALPALAAEQPDIYNAYQQLHGPRVESSLMRASWLVSLIGHEPGRALFVGIYRIDGHRQMDVATYWTLPASRQLQELGDRGPQFERTIRYFDLSLTEKAESFKGRLVLSWPPPERSWVRWASKNTFAIDAILPESALVGRMPHWTSFVFTWSRLKSLPRAWREALSQWRGIYFIHDSGSGKGYVGSAYGEQNLYGRWANYTQSGHGGNVLLRGRDPQYFVFSILQILAHDTTQEDVIKLESSWKDRLSTRAPSGLNDN